MYKGSVHQYQVPEWGGWEEGQSKVTDFAGTYGLAALRRITLGEWAAWSTPTTPFFCRSWEPTYSQTPNPQEQECDDRLSATTGSMGAILGSETSQPLQVSASFYFGPGQHSSMAVYFGLLGIQVGVCTL